MPSTTTQPIPQASATVREMVEAIPEACYGNARLIRPQLGRSPKNGKSKYGKRVLQLWAHRGDANRSLQDVGICTSTRVYVVISLRGGHPGGDV